MFDKLRLKLKSFNQPPLGNSLGTVIRNYGKAPAFQPERQLTGITYKAIDKIGLTLSVYEPIVEKPNGDPYVGHPLYNLFNRPNPNCNNASYFIHLWAMLDEIYGETFWYKARGERSKKVKEVYLLPPDRMEVKIHDGELIGYILHKQNGSHVPFLPDEIYHDKRPNPFNEWRGMSVLEKAAVYVNTEIVTSQFTLNYISNAASPSGIVSLPDMDRDVFQQFTSQWREGYEGPQNAGKTAFIRGAEAKFQAVGSTLKDIDQKVTRQMAKDDVLMMLDVPKTLLGLTDENGFGRANVEALGYVYASQKLEPMMRRLDRIYEHLALELGAQSVNITHASPIPEDKEHKLATYEKGINKWLLANEIRAEMGLEPIKGGDVLVANNVSPEPQKSLKVVKKTQLTKAQLAKKLNAEQESFRENLVEINEIYAKKVKSTLSKHLIEQEKEVIGKINASSKAFEEWMFAVKEDSEKLALLLTPVLIELMEAQSEGVANFISGELLVISPEMRSKVDLNIKQLSGVFNADTITALEKTLSEGQTAGESLTKLKKRVESVYSDAKGYRAERIARTETLKSSNATAEEVYKQNGYSYVEWFVNPGACEFCQSFSGTRKEVGGKFSNLGDVVTSPSGNQLRIEHDDINTPPLHPNCTCSLVPAD